MGQYFSPFSKRGLIQVTTQLLHIGNILTLGFSLGCAYAPTTGTFIAFRFLSEYQSADPKTKNTDLITENQVVSPEVPLLR